MSTSSPRFVRSKPPSHAVTLDLRAKSIAGATEGFTSRTSRLAGLTLAVIPWWQRFGGATGEFDQQGWGKWMQMVEGFGESISKPKILGSFGGWSCGFFGSYRWNREILSRLNIYS